MCSSHGGSAPEEGRGVWKPEDMYGAEVPDPDAGKELSAWDKAARLPKKVLIACFRFYQRGISPLFPRTCRFVPSCSQYAIIAVQRHGLVKGGWLATKRLLKCGPWHPGGYDPVP